jgi:hypothetical protein
MQMPEVIRQEVERLDKALDLPGIDWKPAPSPPHDTDGYLGSAADGTITWIFVVIKHLGRYDGTAAHNGGGIPPTVIHMTPELAKKAWEKATA